MGSGHSLVFIPAYCVPHLSEIRCNGAWGKFITKTTFKVCLEGGLSKSAFFRAT